LYGKPRHPKMRAVMAQQGENLHITTTSFLTGRPKCTHYPNIVVWVKLLNISSKIGSHSAKGEQERSQSGSRWEICISWLLTTVFVAEWPKFTLIWIGLMSVLQLIMLTLNVSRSRGVQTKMLPGKSRGESKRGQNGKTGGLIFVMYFLFFVTATYVFKIVKNNAFCDILASHCPPQIQ